jgi:hypothetical protein
MLRMSILYRFIGKRQLKSRTKFYSSFLNTSFISIVLNDRLNDTSKQFIVNQLK